jgi:maleylpyruvate isomerase
MPASAWQRTVRWTTGHESEASLVVPMRLGEVLIHHVDLDIGYRPRDWPTAFVSDYLDRAVSTLRGHAEWPGAVRMEATERTSPGPSAPPIAFRPATTGPVNISPAVR